ncbi:DUF805 domain-containing protein [Vreelandella populi]|uniref:DUF805 domain-containing protein n=1 Tax=Vreelandella populi TaxID=2498858 RepID=UPI000F8DD6A5|nr:DUF805 domain-containing protein [Halomonas populi]RUR53066.1 DUF805 domain-containing protein [Halomonas populi]
MTKHSSTNDQVESKVPGDQPDIFKSRGRLGRIRFITYSMLVFILWAAIGAVSNMLWQLYYQEWHDILSFSMIFISVLASVMGIIFCTRRLNDFNASGWWMLIFFVPIAMPVMLFMMFFIPGTPTENRFGPIAIQNTTWVYVTLCSMLAILYLTVAL